MLVGEGFPAKIHTIHDEGSEDHCSYSMANAIGAKSSTQDAPNISVR